MAEFDWHAYGFVISSEYRKKIVSSLGVTPRTPKQISVSTSLHLNHVSSTLAVLEKLRVVSCLTPELRKGKLFALTELGREISSKIEGQEASV